MLKKTLSYTDYNGNERTETFYFNLSKAELAEMELGVNGGFSEMVSRISEKQDGATLIKMFKDIILKAYGEKSLDGKRFVKSPELSAAFSQTEAFVEIFMELATDAKAAADFINGITPKDVPKVEAPIAPQTNITEITT